MKRRSTLLRTTHAATPLSRTLLCTVLFLGYLGATVARAAEAPAAGPKLGVWSIQNAQSANGTIWNGTLTLRRQGAKYTGGFDWASAAQTHTGTENVTGTFDAHSRHLTLQGVTESGNIQGAKYTATVSADGKSLTQGTWTGTSDSPGQWSAKFQSVEASGPVAGGPKSGAWSVRNAQGGSSRLWDATLTLKASGTHYTGSFAWKAQDGGYQGTEQVHGDYDAQARQLTLRGALAAGDVEGAVYHATVSDDGTSLTDGTWTGTSDSPGQWSATFQHP